MGLFKEFQVQGVIQAKNNAGNRWLLSLTTCQLRHKEVDTRPLTYSSQEHVMLELAAHITDHDTAASEACNFILVTTRT